MKSKAYAKKALKFKMQRDWMIALTVTFTFLFLGWFGQIDWTWYWLVSPIWVLLSFYLLCGTVGMTWYYLVIKKEMKKAKWEMMNKSLCGKYCSSFKNCDCFKSINK